MMSMTRKDFDYYVSLPYKVVLYPSPEGVAYWARLEQSSLFKKKAFC